MPEVTEQAVVEAEGQAMAANAVVMEAITDAMFGTVATAADSAATRYIPVTIDGVDYLLLAKLAP
jgi:hypothetical protein